jgi:nitrous oxidase accessory protein
VGRTAISVLTASLLVIVFALALASLPISGSRGYHATLGEGLSQDFTDLIFLDFLDVHASIYYAHPGTIVHVCVEFSVTWTDYGGFWVEARYNGSAIARKSYILIGSGTAIHTIDFAWNTSGLEPGAYLITAAASTYSSYEDGYVHIQQTLTVPDDYATIQAAINAANKGDIVFVRSGTYIENVVVNRTISLVGEAAETTIIDGNGTRPVVIIETDDVTITSFTLQNAPYDVDALSVRSSGNHISHNIVTNSGFGIAIDRAGERNTIVNNQVISNWASGIHVMGYNNTVYRNHVTQSHYTGITLLGGGNHSVTENVIADTAEKGLCISDSLNNTICQNTVAGNGVGVYLLSNYPPSPNASGNHFCHNNFVNNTWQVTVWYARPSSWDNGFEGNYWSDYDGTDVNGDGIGDTPYVINEHNQDHYPLMNQYWNPGDIDHDLDVDIYDVVKCAIAYGSIPSDPHWNPHCDIAEPHGVIDMFDIVVMCNCYGEEYNP